MIIRTLYALCNHRCRYISLLEFKHEAIPTLLLLCNLYFKIVPRCRFDSMIIWWVPFFFLVEVRIKSEILIVRGAYILLFVTIVTI